MSDTDPIVIGQLETIKHIHEVRRKLFGLIEELDERARNHDQSKLESPEKELFGEHGIKLIETEYGTPEYDELLTKVQPAIDHHYANNKHHPEHWANGIEDMSLIDIIEMLADWSAAVRRNRSPGIHKSFDINVERYKIEPQLASILRNTIERYIDK